MYRTDVYYLSKTLADLPVYIAFPFLFVAISYFAIGLNPGVDRFFICCGITILVANVATSFGKIQFEIMQKNKLFLITNFIAGYMVSCLSNSTEMAQVISAPLIIPFMLFGGFFLQNGNK